MRHTDTISWRFRQRALDDDGADELIFDRATALQARPLVERHLPAFLSALAPAPGRPPAIAPVNELPITKTKNDERSVIVPQPIRDYVACKAFALAGLDALFVVSIGVRRVRVQLVTRRFRWRGALTPASGPGLRWLPPGDYALWQELGAAGWGAAEEAEPAIERLFAQLRDQAPLVRRAARQAAADARRAALIRRGRAAARALGFLALALAYLLLLLWCLVAGAWIVPAGGG